MVHVSRFHTFTGYVTVSWKYLESSIIMAIEYAFKKDLHVSAYMEYNVKVIPLYRYLFMASRDS